MWNGFFDLKKIKDTETLKQFYKDALDVSISSHVDILKSFQREHFEEITSDEYIKKHISLTTHNVCIDIFEYNQKANWSDRIGEIGSSTFTSPSLFLFIYLELDELYKLVDKYNLEKKLF